MSVNLDDLDANVDESAAGGFERQSGARLKKKLRDRIYSQNAMLMNVFSGIRTDCMNII